MPRKQDIITFRVIKASPSGHFIAETVNGSKRQYDLFPHFPNSAIRATTLRTYGFAWANKLVQAEANMKPDAVKK